MAGLFGGTAAASKPDMTWQEKLGILGASFQDAGANLQGRQGGSLTALQARQKKAMQDAAYQASIAQLFGTPELNGVQSTPLAPGAAAMMGQPDDIAGRIAAQENNAQPMTMSGPLGQSLGYEQASALAPILGNLEADQGLPVMLQALQGAQQNKLRRGERLEDRTWNRQDRQEDINFRNTTRAEDRQWDVQDRNSMTAYQKAQLGLEQQQLALARQKASAAPSLPGAPAGYRWKADGTGLEAIPGGPATKDTDTQRVTALYADRASEANDILSNADIAAAGSNIAQRGAGRIPAIGNFIVSKEYQQADQAKRNFINAVLRRESGAVINPSEFENADKQYFDQPGDSLEVKLQKSANRDTAITGLYRASGTGGVNKESGPPKITSNEEFTRLPSGTEFIGPDGKTRRKP